MIGEISFGKGSKRANRGNTAVVNKKCGNVVTPLFITCDPARDTPPVVLSLITNSALPKTNKRKSDAADKKSYENIFPSSIPKSSD